MDESRETMLPWVFVTIGPDRNLLGRREPEIRGRTALAGVEAMREALAAVVAKRECDAI